MVHNRATSPHPSLKGDAFSGSASHCAWAARSTALSLPSAIRSSTMDLCSNAYVCQPMYLSAVMSFSRCAGQKPYCSTHRALPFTSNNWSAQGKTAHRALKNAPDGHVSGRSLPPIISSRMRSIFSASRHLKYSLTALTPFFSLLCCLRKRMSRRAPHYPEAYGAFSPNPR